MSNYIEIIRNKITAGYNQIKTNIPVVIMVYFGIVLAHFVSSNLYPKLCCKITFWGFIMTPFMVVTPHCEALRWIVHYTGEQIRNAWIWLGGYLVWYFGNYITPFISNFRSKELSEENGNENESYESENEDNALSTTSEPVTSEFRRRNTRSSVGSN